MSELDQLRSQFVKLQDDILFEQTAPQPSAARVRQYRDQAALVRRRILQLERQQDGGAA